MHRTGALIAASLFVVVLGLPLTIVLVLEPSTSEAACGTERQPDRTWPRERRRGSPSGFCRSMRPPLSTFSSATTGWAYLAALNYAESSFGQDNGPGTGVAYGAAPSGRGGPDGDRHRRRSVRRVG